MVIEGNIVDSCVSADLLVAVISHEGRVSCIIRQMNFESATSDPTHVAFDIGEDMVSRTFLGISLTLILLCRYTRD